MGSNQKIHPLRGIERYAINFLISKKVFIDLRKKKIQRKKGQPDFYDTNGQGWEIKLIADATAPSGNIYPRITFQPLQVKNFKDDVKIVMMKHFQKEPEIIIEFTHIKGFIKNNYLYIHKIPMDKVIKFDSETSGSGKQILEKDLNPFPKRLYIQQK